MLRLGGRRVMHFERGDRGIRMVVVRGAVWLSFLVRKTLFHGFRECEMLSFTIACQAPSAKIKSVSCDAPTLSERTSS